MIFNPRIWLGLFIFSISPCLVAAQTIRHTVHDWDVDRFSDATYLALSKVRSKANQTTYIGKNDFYYQLKIAKNGWPRSRVTCSSGLSKVLSVTTADVVHFAETGLPNDVKNVPLITVGSNVDPSTGGNTSDCRIRPVLSDQVWPLSLFQAAEGVDREEYTIRVSVSRTRSLSTSGQLAWDIIKAITAVPSIAGVIPPGINTLTTTVGDKMIAAGASAPSDYISYRLKPSRDNDSYYRFFLNSDPNAGWLEIFVYRKGSIILDRMRSVNAHTVVLTNLRKADDKFKVLFLDAYPTYKVPIPLADATKSKSLYTLCQDLRYFTEKQELATIDAALLRRSMLIELGYDKALSDNDFLKKVGDALMADTGMIDKTKFSRACWEEETDEKFVAEIVVLRMKRQLDKFGDFALPMAQPK
jgi:hypothetical protein